MELLYRFCFSTRKIHYRSLCCASLTSVISALTSWPIFPACEISFEYFSSVSFGLVTVSIAYLEDALTLGKGGRRRQFRFWKHAHFDCFYVI